MALQCCTTTTPTDECTGWCGILHVNMSARHHGNHGHHRHIPSHSGGQRCSLARHNTHLHTLQACHPDQSNRNNHSKPASVQHATLPLWETGGGGKVASLCTCAGLNLTLCAGQKGEDWCGIGGVGARHKPIVRRASGLSATVSQIRLYHRRSSQIATWLGLCTLQPLRAQRARPRPCLLFTPIPSHCSCFVFLIPTRLYVSRHTHSFRLFVDITFFTPVTLFCCVLFSSRTRAFHSPTNNNKNHIKSPS
jgi:hypothetical protein